ncbi:MAG: hypothetical protein NVS4B12_08590 [Ktedonobacteraceae bacterium]
MVEISQYDISPFLNSFDDGVCCLSTQGELLYANELARKHWNLHQQHADALLRLPLVMRALAGEQTHHVLINRDEQHVLLLNTLPLHDSSRGNAVNAIVIISQDVSEHVLQQHQAELSLDVLVRAVMETQDIHDINEALRRIAALLPQLESVDSSIAFRVNEETRDIELVALFGSSRQSYEEWRAELSSVELNTEQALRTSPAYMRALHLKIPITLDFTSTRTRRRQNHLCAAIYAPVLLNGQVLGLLGIERHRPLGNADTYFPQWSVDLLKSLARLVSMSIERTSLFNTSEHQQEEIETIRALLHQKETFLSLTAHELKNPLTAIRGQAQILQRRIQRSHQLATETNHELLRGMKSIEHQTQKIEHMINALMDVSRLDLDRLQLELKEIDLLQLVKRTLEEYAPIARNHEFHLFVNEQSVPIVEGENEDIPQNALKIQGDEERLEQVLLNLISNAVKYSPNSGSVTVSLSNKEEGTIEIAVKDRGIGIPPEEQERLTERFFRAQNAQSVDAKGLGLGLYLVNTLVAKHGGLLTIQSEGVPGKGSTFTVKLPRQREET